MLRFGQQLLAAPNPLFDRRVPAQAGAGDLIDAESAKNVEDQRHLRWFGQSRMTGGEHHAKHAVLDGIGGENLDRKSTRLNSSHQIISYAVFCLKKKKKRNNEYVH